jgi:hypothetical protein
MSFAQSPDLLEATPDTLLLTSIIGVNERELSFPVRHIDREDESGVAESTSSPSWQGGMTAALAP